MNSQAQTSPQQDITTPESLIGCYVYIYPADALTRDKPPRIERVQGLVGSVWTLGNEVMVVLEGGMIDEHELHIFPLSRYTVHVPSVPSDLAA